MRLSPAILAVALAAGCAALLKEPGPPPARPGEPVMAWKRETPDREGTVVFARNDTTVTLVATFRLFDCVNVNHPCGDLPPRPLEPGVIVELITLRPVDLQKDYTFNYAYTARPQ